MAANLELVIKATDHATKVLNDVDNKASGLSNTLGTGLKVAGAAAAAGIGLAVVAGIDFVKQAAEEEAGIKRLAAAVDANGGSWARQGAAIEKAIQQRQALAFSDDELRSSLALLTAQTGSVDEAMKRQAVAMDLARGAGIDLGSASKLLGKVTDESHGALSRLGIVVDKNADSMEVMAAVQQRFGGQAATFADTAQGKWARFGIALDNIKESIGSALLPIVTKLGEALAGFVEEHQEDIDRLSQAFAAWAESDAMPFIMNAFEQLIQLIEGIMDTGIIQWLAEHKELVLALALALGILVIAFGGPIPVILAIIAVGTLLLANWDAIRNKAVELANTVVEQVTKIIETVKGIPIIGEIFEATLQIIATLVTTYFEIVRIQIETAMQAIRAIVEIVLGIIHGDFDRVWNGIKDLVGALLGGLLAMVNALLDGLRGFVGAQLGLVVGIFGDMFQAAMEAARAAISGLPGLIADVLGRARDTVLAWVDNFEAFGLRLVRSFADGISKGIGAIGDVIKRIIDKLNPANWDIPFLSPFFQAFRHAGEKAVDELGRGLDKLPRIQIPMEVLQPRIPTLPAIAPLSVGLESVERTGIMGTQPAGIAGTQSIVIHYSPTFSTASATELETFKGWLANTLRSEMAHG